MAAERPRGAERGPRSGVGAERLESSEGDPAEGVVALVTVPGGPGSPDLRVVRLAGDVNRKAVPQVEAALADLDGRSHDDPPQRDAPLGVVDLTRLRYLDDRGVRALFAVADRFAAAGRTLHVVAGAGSESERVARIMQLETFVAVHGALDDVAGCPPPY